MVKKSEAKEDKKEKKVKKESKKEIKKTVEKTVKKLLKEKKKAVKKIADKEFFEVEKVAQLAAKTLSTGKAEDIVTIDLTGKSALADFLVVATGRAPRHVTALAEQVQTKLKKTGVKATLEGEDVGDWVIADAGGVIVHVFTQEARDMYRIEELWGEETPKKG